MRVVLVTLLALFVSLCLLAQDTASPSAESSSPDAASTPPQSSSQESPQEQTAAPARPAAAPAPAPARADTSSAAAQRPSVPYRRSEGAALSLPPEQIIPLLQKDPGLNLQVKRMLVRKAAELGRILYEDELTDETLFQLIRTDTSIRKLVIQEIAARGYFPVRPTPQEAAQERASQQRAELAQRRAMAAAEREDASARMRDGAVPDAQAAQAAAAADYSQMPVESDVNTSTIRPDQLPGLFAGGATPGAMPTSGLGGQAGMMQPTSGSSALSAADLASMPATSETDMAAAGQPVAPTPSVPSRFRKTAPDRTPVIEHRPNPYSDVPSLYDLYAQVNPRTPRLERFGSEVFREGTGNFNQLPMDVPVGPDYVIGPGDGLKIDLWGAVSQRLQRIVDREGRVALPEVGTVQVAGRTLGDAQREIQAVLRTQFREVSTDVSLLRLRTVRIYVVGFVNSPGAYDLSSLSTPLNAIYTAGGPTDNGSMRAVRHMRGKELVETVDLYDLLLHGTRQDSKLMQAGDTIVVPPVGPSVTVEGMVRRPAIYELNGEDNLAQVLQLAGGVLPTGTLRHIEVERLQAHEKRTMLRLDIPESNDSAKANEVLDGFKVQDADLIRISPILPYADQTVYLDGHVFRPGKYAYHGGMQVADLIKGYTDLLPEPSLRHAEIIRLTAPDYRPEVIGINLADALARKADVPPLQPYDTVRVFSRYQFEDPPVVTVGGEVRDPGEHRTNGETHLRDAIYLAGGLTPQASTSDVQVFRLHTGGSTEVFDVNLAKALAGDPIANILLTARDRVVVQRNMAVTDPATVSIQGEVASPGKYPFGAGMTASDLVRMAGGLKRSAFTDAADLSRYVVQNNKRILGAHEEVALAEAMTGNANANVKLRDGDVLTVRQLAGWNDIGAAVTINGEVLHPGTYGIREGEKLSSVLKRAGGFRATAYPYGAVLERVQVRQLAEKNRDEMVRRLEAGQNFQGVKVGFTATPSEQAATVQAASLQQQQILASVKSQPASGRLVIHVNSDLARWQGTIADVELRAGDVITIPKRPNFVMINGQVYNPNALTFTPGKSATWYLRQAGGMTGMANKKAIYIIRADGSVIGQGGSAWWHGNVLSTRMQPGDTIVVPERILSASPFLRDLMSTAQIASSLAIAARVATSF